MQRRLLTRRSRASLPPLVCTETEPNPSCANQKDKVAERERIKNSTGVGTSSSAASSRKGKTPAVAQKKGSRNGPGDQEEKGSSLTTLITEGWPDREEKEENERATGGGAGSDLQEELSGRLTSRPGPVAWQGPARLLGHGKHHAYVAFWDVQEYLGKGDTGGHLIILMSYFCWRPSASWQLASPSDSD